MNTVTPSQLEERPEPLPAFILPWTVSHIACWSWSTPLVNWHLVSRSAGVRFLSERWALVHISGLCARHGGVWLDRLVAILMLCGEEGHISAQKILLHCPHRQTSLKGKTTCSENHRCWVTEKNVTRGDLLIFHKCELGHLSSHTYRHTHISLPIS